MGSYTIAEEKNFLYLNFGLYYLRVFQILNLVIETIIILASIDLMALNTFQWVLNNSFLASLFQLSLEKPWR